MSELQKKISSLYGEERKLLRLITNYCFRITKAKKPKEVLIPKDYMTRDIYYLKIYFFEIKKDDKETNIRIHIDDYNDKITIRVSLSELENNYRKETDYFITIYGNMGIIRNYIKKFKKVNDDIRNFYKKNDKV